MKIFKSLTTWVVLAIVLGIMFGYFFPAQATEMKWLGDLFIKMIKMVIAPIVFFTIVVGFANMGDMKKIGRIGGKALLYFEIVTTAALAIGIAVVTLINPGGGMDTSKLKAADIATYSKQGAEANHGFTAFISSVVPDNVVGAFAKGELLPVLFFSVFFGLAMASLGVKAKPVTAFFERLNEIFFKVVSYIMYFAPVAAFGAMSYTIGKFGLKSLWSLGQLMGSVYITMFLFIVVVLGGIAKFYGFSVFKLIKYIKEEIFLVLGTSSSESALPRVMKKLEDFGCSKPVVGLVVPTGYSFNLDGTSIYLSMAAIFICQAMGVHLSFMQILTLIGILMLTSKGAAGVTGSGLITLAATIAALPGNMIPMEGIALLVGVDRFMSEARAITNLIGNSVATVVVAKMENEFDESVNQQALSGTPPQPPVSA